MGNAKWEADDEAGMGHNFSIPSPQLLPLQLSVSHFAEFRIVFFLFFQSFALVTFGQHSRFVAFFSIFFVVFSNTS